MSVWKKYGYAWVTLAFFLFSLLLHLIFGWEAFRNEAMEHSQAPQWNEFMVEWGRDVFENWQSEFLQLLWQVGGLAFLLFVGSPQSKEEDDRLEEKLDAILRAVDAKNAEKLIEQLDKRFPGRDTGPKL
jgi:hypothetical protein